MTNKFLVSPLSPKKRAVLNFKEKYWRTRLITKTMLEIYFNLKNIYLKCVFVLAKPLK